LEFGAEDFTIEFWIYRIGSSGFIMAKGDGATAAGSSFQINFGIDDCGFVFDGSSVAPLSLSSLSSNIWQHVAFVRYAGDIVLYIDGTEADRTTIGNAIVNDVAQPLIIGNYVISALESYIDELRIIKGYAAYTNNFTPPNEPFTLFIPTPTPTPTVTVTPTNNWWQAASPSLLLHFNGDNESTTFIDSSINNLSVSGVGGTLISTDQSKFGGSSAYFNNSQLVVTDNDGSPVESLSFGSGEFNVDFWVYLTGGSTYKTMIELGTNGSYPSDRLGLTIYPSNQLRVENYAMLLEDPNVFPTDTWVHVAVSRDSFSIMRLFINGSGVASGEITQTFTANNVNIGKQWDGEHMNGYIDELRIITGAAIYLSNFTPPSSPFNDPTPTPTASVTPTVTPTPA
jgi:hypothetical protein